MLCPHCLKENKKVEMRIVGMSLHCPECNYTKDFPRRIPTHYEYERLLEQKNETIAELEDKIIELEQYIKQIEKRGAPE